MSGTDAVSPARPRQVVGSPSATPDPAGATTKLAGAAASSPRRRWRRLARLFSLIYRGYYRTLRLRGWSAAGEDLDPRRFAFDAEIWALCERDSLALAGLAAARGFTALVAHGRDGDWAAAALAALGCEVVRGSSRRGGWPALRSLTRRLATVPGPLAIVVDGPVGPAGRARPGALACARASGLPVRPVAAAAPCRLVFPRTWSGIYLPLPFAELRIALGETLLVPAATMDGELADLARELERRLAEALRRAAGDRGGVPAPGDRPGSQSNQPEQPSQPGQPSQSGQPSQPSQSSQLSGAAAGGIAATPEGPARR